MEIVPVNVFPFGSVVVAVIVTLVDVSPAGTLTTVCCERGTVPPESSAVAGVKVTEGSDEAHVIVGAYVVPTGGVYKTPYSNTSASSWPVVPATMFPIDILISNAKWLWCGGSRWRISRKRTVFSRVDSSISLNSLSWLDFILKPPPNYLTPNLRPYGVTAVPRPLEA